MRSGLAVWLAVLVIASGCSIFQTDANTMDPMIDAIHTSGKQAIAANEFVEAQRLLGCMDLLKIEQSIVANRGKLPQDMRPLEKDVMGRYNETLKQHLAPGDYDKLRALRRKYNYQQYVE